MKRTLLVLVISVLLCCMCAGIFSNAAETATDPADVYVPQVAPNEDSDIKMWFEHSFKKVMTSDTTPSGMDTYSVYMGKNEVENAQFVLYSDVTKSRLRATVSNFTDANGNTISAEVYYQMYITLNHLDTLGYQGATAENTFIRNGEQPDPVVPMSKAGLIQLNAGKSQAFYIRLETTEDSQPGWYSAQLDIKNAQGKVVKTATVYAYVWDFTLSDESPLQTSFYLGNKPDQFGNFETYYNYLLENRMNAMDIPGGISSNNKYLTDPRVNSIRVSASINGAAYKDDITAFPSYVSIYNDVSSMKEWEDIKDKFYFYTIDEAMSDEQQQGIVDHYAALGIVKPKGSTVDDVIRYANNLDLYWQDAAKVVPYHENHPYPYNVYNNQTMATLDPRLLYDGAQAMMDSESINIWCPQIYAFTPLKELDAHGYYSNPTCKIRSLSGSISGSIRAGEGYFNWERVFGEFRDRAISSNIIRNEEGAGNNVLWAYSAGWNKSYSYCNHLIESSGLQTKMLFWQLYQNDVTGYLYYGTNNWTEYMFDLDGDGAADDVPVDKTVTGTRTGGWHTNEHRYDLGGGNYHAIFGNGMLFYQASQGGFTNGLPYVGSIRIDHIRDGIDEYQMLTMLEELEGDAAADEIVGSVSKNIVNYLSMPAFDRSGFDSQMDDYDVMAEVRKELGFALEAAVASECHHVYDDGKVTKPATCLELGEKTYTCTLCGAGSIEYIPALHTEGSCFDVETITATGCTTNGKYLYTCRICDYAKYVTTKSYHTDPDHLIYDTHPVMTAVHKIICDVCNAELRTENHSYLAEYTNTCTDAGVHNNKCKFCGYAQKVADVEAKGHYLVESYKAPTCTEEGHKGAECYNCDYSEAEILEVIDHNYVDGKCTMCGESDGSVSATPGDVDGDGEVTMLDLFALKLFIKQKDIPTDAEVAAGDIDGDGELTMVDSFELKYRISKGFWRE